MAPEWHFSKDVGHHDHAVLGPEWMAARGKLFADGRSQFLQQGPARLHRLSAAAVDARKILNILPVADLGES